MNRYYIALILMLTFFCQLSGMEFEWGIKYGAGLSSLSGDESDHELRYEIQKQSNVMEDVGYLRIRSAETKSNLAQNLGIYTSFLLSKDAHSLWFQPELLWQRYTYRYDFFGKMPETNSILLVAEFADTLNGHIDKTMDYLTLPLLFKMKQGLSAEELQGSYQGAYMYFGPSASFLLDNRATYHKGINALERKIDTFVTDQSDATTTYSRHRVESGSDKLLDYKVDLVIGMGIGIKDIFRMGLGNDEFILDLRITAGLHSLGDAPARQAFNLRSAVLSLGYKL